ncbi:MAG: major facilitator superfamily transporter [Bacteroidetes bacterium]|jgi:MFS family permease|nr:major facilitator superfamily transporter [Bacteroidota bacterium]
MTAAPETPIAANLPPPRWYRWMVLVLISLAMFGNYYIYDSISPLADVLKAQLGFSDADIGWLNAIYSLPNIFMVLIGGIIIDRIGIRRSVAIFAALCLVGATITVSSGVLEIMAAGRLVFGLGAESLIVAVTTAVAKWFRGKELSLAFGLNLTIARLGSFAALNSPSWGSSLYESWRLPLLVSVAAGVICVAGATIYWVLERTGEKKYDLGKGGSTDKVVLADLMRFGTSYWMIVALCVVFYSAVFPFQTFAVKFFIEAHGTTRETGGFLSSILTLFAMIATPIFGYSADRYGRRASLMVFGSILLIPAYLLMAYTSLSLYIPMAMMGVAFSLIPAVMWPSVAYIVGQERLGTAYGLMTMIQNIGLAGFNLLIGWTNDASGASVSHPEGYVPGMWIFTVLGILGVFFALLLLRRERGPQAHGLETITIAHH